MRRILFPLILLVAAAYGAIAWYVSNRIGNEALLAAYDHGPPACDDAIAVAVGDSTVVLKPVGDDSSRVRRGAPWGIRWKGGWAVAGPVVGVHPAGVERRFVAGEGTLAPGTPVDLSATPSRSDPMRACGLPYEDIAILAPLGPMPAWLIPGPSDTWVVFVHGKGADRAQALATLPIYVARGFPCLVITYRNDLGAPQNPDGKYHYGLAEWRDLEAACSYAAARGAERFVLVGFSMGGGVVLDFLEESAMASRVRGVVLDAPAIDFGRTVDLGIRLARLPVLGTPMPPLVGPLSKELATLRFGVNWREYELIRRADRLSAPILILHGDADDVVPFDGSVALAHARPDLVTLVPFPGAHHVEAWNLDRARYEAAVIPFLAPISAPRPGP